MINYILQRFVYMIGVLLIISFLSFLMIQLPPGDYVSYLINQYRRQGIEINENKIEYLKEKYGLNQSVLLSYYKWITNIILHGDFGESFAYGKPVIEVILNRLPWTLLVSSLAAILSYSVAIPLGVYSATHKYSFFDNTFTTMAFLGKSIPNFFLALLMIFILVVYFDAKEIGSLFSSTYADAPWSLAKLIDLAKHLWLPVIAVGTAAWATIIRVVRGNLLDVIEMQFVQTARAKGLKESTVIWKHALIHALHPVIMGFGTLLPRLFSGTVLVGIVLSLPMLGVAQYEAVLQQDMYLAGSILLFLCALLLLGNLLADLLLAWVDPRIRYF